MMQFLKLACIFLVCPSFIVAGASDSVGHEGPKTAWVDGYLWDLYSSISRHKFRLKEDKIPTMVETYWGYPWQLEGNYTFEDPAIATLILDTIIADIEAITIARTVINETGDFSCLVTITVPRVRGIKFLWSQDGYTFEVMVIDQTVSIHNQLQDGQTCRLAIDRGCSPDLVRKLKAILQQTGSGNDG